MMRARLWLLWLLASAAPGLAVAEVAQGFSHDQELLLSLYGSEEVISIATGSGKQVHRAPAAATVITAEEIKASGARTLDQVLEQVPGLHVSPSTLSRLDAVYSLRGIHTAYNPQVLVLMNGSPFPHLFSGGRPVTFQLPVENIARVEVIRGPGSAIYGADALAGVINVITKSPEELRGTRAGVRLGSFGAAEGWLQHGGQWGGWQAALSLEWQQADGDTGRLVDRDLQSLFNPALSRAPGPLESAYHLLNAQAELSRGPWTVRGWGWVQNDGGMGPGGAQALDPNGKQELLLGMGDVTYHKANWLPAWDGSVHLNYFYSKDDSYFQLFPPGQFHAQGWIGNPISYDQQTTLEATGLYGGWARHQLRINTGLKYAYEDTEEFKNFGPGVMPGVLTDVTDTPYVFLKPQDRTILFLSLQDEWNFAPDWELTAGVRYDHYSDFGDTINPRLALVWATRHDLTTKLMYGRAFRAPSFSELYAINNPAVLGNPGLEPEYLNTVELAFDYRPTPRLRTSLSLFHYDVDGLIAFIPDPGGTASTAQNANDQTGHGFELEAEWKATDTVKLQGNFSLNRALNANTDARIAETPARKLFMATHWLFAPDWSLHAKANWVMDRARAPGDLRDPVDDYVWVDLVVRRQRLAKQWEAALLVQNLFNGKAREPGSAAIHNDMPLEGIGVFGEVRYEFR